MGWRKPKVFNNKRNAFGSDVFALQSVEVNKAENKDKLSFSVLTQKTHRKITFLNYTCKITFLNYTW